MAILFALLLLFGTDPASGQGVGFEKTPFGVRVGIGPARIEAAVAGDGAFRLSVSNRQNPVPAASSFLSPAPSPAPAGWTVVQTGGYVGVESAAGALLVNPRDGSWTLRDSRSNPLIPPGALSDPTAGRDASDPSVRLLLGWPRGKPIAVYGCGNQDPVLRHIRASTGVGNGLAVIPYYWSDSGYAVLAVSADDDRPASWAADSAASRLRWTFPGATADLYLMPAPDLAAAARAYAKLSGHAPVPPRWTFGYLQSRWGWKDRAYIESTLEEFRRRRLPVDAFIFDFEWFTPTPDYLVKPQGLPDYADFGWNPALFPQPARQLASYKRQGIRAVVIRKPRLGNESNLKLIRSRGWNVPTSEQRQLANQWRMNLGSPAHLPMIEQYHIRDMNFRSPGMRAWYADRMRAILADGVEGLWNDEGDSTYMTYYYWNQAEAASLAQVRPGARLWTLNRSFQPGLQRLGAAAWTGDINSTWDELAATPADLLNWSLAGMPYGACDIGGFSDEDPPELLARWMEAGVFFPVMRSHSRYNLKPRFPWLYGAEAEAAIRRALELRYRLIPMYYSLAHETYSTGLPLMRPLLMEFPGDSATANLTDQWMIGPRLMAAPVLRPGGRRRIYLPSDNWYRFDGNQRLAGGKYMEVDAALDEIPIFVRAGSLLTLGPVVQSTSWSPGGPLQVQIYPGRDATAALVEDDGESDSYRRGELRRTRFVWDDSRRRLSWQIEGSYRGAGCFERFDLVLFDPAGIKKAHGLLARAGSLDL